MRSPAPRFVAPAVLAPALVATALPAAPTRAQAPHAAGFTRQPGAFAAQCGANRKDR